MTVELRIKTDTEVTVSQRDLGAANDPSLHITA